MRRQQKEIKDSDEDALQCHYDCEKGMTCCCIAYVTIFGNSNNWRDPYETTNTSAVNSGFYSSSANTCALAFQGKSCLRSLISILSIALSNSIKLLLFFHRILHHFEGSLQWCQVILWNCTLSRIQPLQHNSHTVRFISVPCALCSVLHSWPPTTMLLENLKQKCTPPPPPQKKSIFPFYKTECSHFITVTFPKDPAVKNIYVIHLPRWQHACTQRLAAPLTLVSQCSETNHEITDNFHCLHGIPTQIARPAGPPWIVSGADRRRRRDRKQNQGCRSGLFAKLRKDLHGPPLPSVFLSKHNPWTTK